jgi:hypothetical protein
MLLLLLESDDCGSTATSEEDGNMSGQDHRAPDAPVEQPPRGFNGLPELEELGVGAPTDIADYRSRRPGPGTSTASLVPWAAVALMVVPAAVACWTLFGRRRRRASAFSGRATQLSHDEMERTPPHGDKLLFRPHAERRAQPASRPV